MRYSLADCNGQRWHFHESIGPGSGPFVGLGCPSAANIWPKSERSALARL